MKHNIWLLMVLVSINASALPTIMGNQKHRPAQSRGIDEQMGRSFHARVDIETARLIGQGYGGSIEFGWMRDLFGVDLRLKKGSMQFQSFFTKPTDKEIAAGVEQGSFLSTESELSRERVGTSTWTYTTVERGVSVTGQLLPSKWFKNFSQTARFGVGRAFFKDSANGYSFSGWIYSPEAVVRYHFSPQSRYTAHLGFNMNWGSIARSDMGDNSKTDTSLPVNYIHYFMGVAYSW